jgi:predicted DNA-binding transcriptional regulator YafY
MNKFDRLYELHKRLAGRRTPVATSELMHTLECSEPTVRRLIAKLRDELGAPVRFDRARGGWVYQHGDDARQYELPGLWFSAGELQALLASHQWLAQVEPGLLGSEIAPLVARLERLLDARQPGGGKLSHRVKLIALGARRIDDHVFRSVAGALAEDRRIAFNYHGRQRDALTRRKVSPLRLTWYKSNWYLDAWCHLRDGLRSFALDRIAAPERLDIPARAIDASQQTRHYASTYGIFSGAAKHTAVLRFSAGAARWVADERWHHAQNGHFLTDGGYELSVPYGNPTELIMDILKYGDDVEVVSPPALRDAVKARLERALHSYG